MNHLSFIALLLAVLGPLLALARLVRLPDSIALVAVGAAATLMPGSEPLRVDPHLALNLFLPPLLYASTVRVSFYLLRFTLASGVLIGLGLALATIGAVAVAARWLFPGLGWMGAVLLGVVAALFDTRVFHEAKNRPQVPRIIGDALKAREMTARVVALAVFAIVQQAITDGPPTPTGAAANFVYMIVGGAIVGIVVGRAVAWLRARIDPAPVEIAVSIATPYLSALAARGLELSVVTAVMAAALTMSAMRIDSRTGAPGSSSEARISSMAFWEELSLLLSAVLFFLAGYGLPQAVQGLGRWPMWSVVASAAAILAVVWAVQYMFAWLSTRLPSVAATLRAEGGRADTPRHAAAAVMVWASTRSVIGLIVALAIPATHPNGEPFAERDLVLVIAALVILGSVLLQGLTLGAAVRVAALGDERNDKREEKIAEQAMCDAHAGAKPAGDAAACFDAERRALLALRREDAIGDEVLRKMLRETDLRSRAAEHSALPGAGPPNP